MEGFKKVLRVQAFFKNAGVAISGIVIIFMMLFIVIDVLLRNITGFSIPGGYNYVEKYLMPFIVFPALAFVYSAGVLPRLDVLVNKFSKNNHLIINLVMRIIDLVLFSLMFYYSLKYMVAGTIQGTAFTAGGSLAPLAPSLIIATIGFLVLVIEIIVEIFKSIKFIKKPKSNSGVTEFSN